MVCCKVNVILIGYNNNSSIFVKDIDVMYPVVIFCILHDNNKQFNLLTNIVVENENKKKIMLPLKWFDPNLVCDVLF